MAWKRLRASALARLDGRAWQTQVDPRIRLVPFGWGIAAAALSTLVSYTGRSYFQLADLIMIHLLGVVIVAMQFPVVPSLFAAVISVLSFDFFFTPPALAFAIPDLGSLVTFAGMLVVAGVISGLTERLRRQEAAARQREASTRALYAMSRELAGLREPQELAAAASRHIGRMFDAHADIVIGEGNAVEPSSKDGRTTNTLLIASGKPVGVLRLASSVLLPFERAEQRNLLEACASQTATAIERTLFARDAQDAQVQIETERLRNSLLSAVSHDLKTPLAAILGAGTTLRLGGPELGEPTRQALAETVIEESERLNRYLTNLLDMMRLEAGAIPVQRQPEPVEEVIEAALSRLSGRMGDRKVLTIVPEDVPLLPMDPLLIEHVFINLLENALKYTPTGSPIEVVVSQDGEDVVIEVSDHGEGIAPEEAERLFEKFYRSRRSQGTDGGVGLGLTICRAIVQAHRGTISIANRQAGGATVRFTLPTFPARSKELDWLERPVQGASHE